MNLKIKKVLITGATGGIGYYFSKKIYNLGSNVLGSGTNEDKLKQLKEEFPIFKQKNSHLMNIQN